MERITTQVYRNYKIFSESSVDIIIPYHGLYDKLINLMYSIFKYNKLDKYSVCLVDDASPNISVSEKLSNWGIKVIRNQTQMGFGASLYQGFINTNNPWVIFMHSDCEVNNMQWLANLGECLLKLKKNNIKMISPKMNKSTCGDSRIESKEFVMSKDIILTEDLLERDCYLPLTCVMCHRDLFAHIGGFIKSYPYRGYEDLELAHRMRKHGYLQAICGSSWIKHEGHGTIKSLVKKNPKIIESINNNRNICIKDLKL